MLLMLILIGVSSCSNEDENIGNIPSQLIKTWYMGEGTYITFNADGTGVYTETDEISTAKLMRRTGTRTTDTYRSLIRMKNRLRRSRFISTEMSCDGPLSH
ncbi:MAG: hypothetical protein KHX52_02590 [Phocaeicola plebeius]|nr:hypothetical protein [Phocaeicola plebeius]